MNNRVKFAVLGCGHIGRRHAEMITSNPQASLEALIDIKPQDNLGIDRYDVPFFSSLSEFLENGPVVDVVNIATPNGLHARHSIDCLDAGYNIVVEKPLTLSRNDAEKVIFKALNKHKHVFVVMQNRFSPPSVWIRQLVDSGKLGKIFMVQLNCYWNRDDHYYTKGSWHGTKDLDGGVLFTQFSHFVDMMYWLFGDIKNITSKMNCFSHQHSTEFDDSGMVFFEFLAGGMGSINFSTCSWDKNMESSMTIIAENGSIRIGGQYMDKVEYCHVKDYTMQELAPTNPTNDYGAYKGSAQNHSYVIENVIKVLRNNGNISTNALEGMKVVEIIERIYQSQ